MKSQIFWKAIPCGSPATAKSLWRDLIQMAHNMSASCHFSPWHAAVCCLVSKTTAKEEDSEMCFLTRKLASLGEKNLAVEREGADNSACGMWSVSATNVV